LPDRHWLLADITPLRESAAFRRLWAGTTLSSAGGALTSFAVVLQVYDLTRSPFAVGAVGVAQMVPTLTVGLLGGSVADSTDRRKLVLVTSCCLAGVSAALAAQTFAGLRLVWLLYALVAAQSSLGAVDRPARSTFIPRLLPASQLPAALSLNRLSFQIVLTVAPALAGLIAAAPHLGLGACYLIDAISFAAALYAVARLPAMRPQAGAARPGPRAVGEGISFIRRSPVLVGAFLADLNATVFGLPVALFPAINAERFGGDPRTLGLLTAAIGFGGLASAAFSGPVTHISRQGRAMLAAVAAWGTAFAGFAVAPSLWLTLSLLAAAGAADTFTVVFRGAIVAAVTPDQLRGRLMAADYVVGAGGGQIGNLEAGALGSLTSPTISALSGGLVTIAGAIVISLTLPAFTRYHCQPRDLAPARPAGLSYGTAADDGRASGDADNQPGATGRARPGRIRRLPRRRA
jgi:MFS family permease